MKDYDVCIVGSGAGAAPVAFTLARAGRTVLVLEKGAWYSEKDFFKDEIAECRRLKFFPKPWEEPQMIEVKSGGRWEARSSYARGWNFWNGNMVGGSSNLMSGFFQRFKPADFRLFSELGPVAGSTLADWPVGYEDFEPYYELVEREVGVSGQVVDHPNQEPRSTPNFPYPATAEHPLAKWFDEAGRRLGLHPTPLPRAILSLPAHGRMSCSYSSYCGNYGCATGAKGSARAALLNRALETGNLAIRPHAMVRRLVSDAKGQVTEAEYFDEKGMAQRVSAKIFVVACQAIESARLLLLSTGAKHPHGLGNSSGLVGQNLIFSTGGGAEASFPYNKFGADKEQELRSPLPFINRAFQDWYFYKDPASQKRMKGGTLEFLFVLPNPIALGRFFAFRSDEKMVWGERLKNELKAYVRGARHVTCEIFSDWFPVPDCNVTLDAELKDKWGMPVARVRLASHPLHIKTSRFLVARAKEIFKAMGAEHIEGFPSDNPAVNLVAGTCRFGSDPRHSVLDPDCRVHDAPNLFVSDGSFMPSGGSVPFTWTIYANAFRVADKILAQL